MTDEGTREAKQAEPRPTPALPETSFNSLPEPLQQAAARMGWSQLMPVQSRTIPHMLARRDLMVQSRTGSGKTGAFLLPILHSIQPNLAATQALVMVPTRELALQVTRDAKKMFEGTPVRATVIYGGVGYGEQREGLKAGAHLVIGTPGRILDHLMQRTLDLAELRTLVFDEADRLLSVGFYPDMKQLRSYVTRPYCGYMFSATYTSSVQALAREFLHDPEFLSLSTDAVHVAETEHISYVVPTMDKERCLIRIIEMENPESAIIFCNTKAKVEFVARVLQNFGYDADQLTSDLAQPAREAVLGRLRSSKLRFLVATDLAARGIDIMALSHVILYDFPEDPESYIHRAGRTGRAGAAGVAISLLDLFEESEMRRVAGRYGIEMVTRPVPTDEDVATIVSQRVTSLLEAKLRARAPLHSERMQRFMSLAKSLAETDDELAILAMLLDDFYQGVLHAPLEEFVPLATTPSSEGRPRRRRSKPRGSR